VRRAARGSVVALLDRLQRLAETVVTPGGAGAMRACRPFSLAAFRLVRSLVADGSSFATVIDVGANAGQFTAAALHAWPHARVIAFEPLADAAKLVADVAGAARAVEVHQCALGAEDGEIEFFRHTHALSSSALRVSEAARPLPWAEELPGETVTLHRLDTVIAERRLVQPVLLKLDVQGFELEVLAGATATLAQVDAIVLEAAFVPGYAGQPPFATVHEVLCGMGWSLVRPLDFRRESDGRIVEADLLYRRSEDGAGGPGDSIDGTTGRIR
jgi:FkbM family methyltransferase